MRSTQVECFLFITMNDFIDIENIIGNSPTRKAIFEIFPVGSEVDRKGVEELYIQMSKTEKRDKKSSKSKGKGKLFSVRITRKHRGAKFFKQMVRLGHWTPITVNK